jgi:hypothetical protein
VWKLWASDERTGRGRGREGREGRKERWRVLIYLLRPATSWIKNNCGVNHTNQSFCFIDIIVCDAFRFLEMAESVTTVDGLLQVSEPDLMP